LAQLIFVLSWVHLSNFAVIIAVPIYVAIINDKVSYDTVSVVFIFTVARSKAQLN
jgi:hypothetical protein